MYKKLTLSAGLVMMLPLNIEASAVDAFPRESSAQPAQHQLKTLQPKGGEIATKLEAYLTARDLLKPLQDARGNLEDIEDVIIFRRVREAVLAFALKEGLVTVTHK